MAVNNKNLKDYRFLNAGLRLDHHLSLVPLDQGQWTCSRHWRTT